MNIDSVARLCQWTNGLDSAKHLIVLPTPPGKMNEAFARNSFVSIHLFRIGKMKRHVYSASFVLMIVILAAPVLQAQQSDFFWSLRDLNQGAVNEPMMETVEKGQSVSLYLYFSTTGPSEAEIDVGAILDIAASQEGIIQFVSAETFDFSVLVETVEIGERWGGQCPGTVGQIGTVSDSLIQGWGALTTVRFWNDEFHCVG